MLDKKRFRRYFYLILSCLILSFLLFVINTSYISNTLKKIILPELEAISGQKVTAQKIYINIVPLFIEAKDLKIFNKDNSEILSTHRVKGYINFSDILKKEITIKKLIIKEPIIRVNKSQINRIKNNIESYLENKGKGNKTLKVNINTIKLNNGTFSYTDNKPKGILNISGLSGEVIVKKYPEFKISMKSFDFKKDKWPTLSGNLKTSLQLKKNKIEIKNLDLRSYGSLFKCKGIYTKGGSTMKTNISLVVDSVKRIFNLKHKGDGNISANGEIRFSKLNSISNIFVNLKLKGNFYIETLMELLKVKERIEGIVNFRGEIKGPLSNVVGKAKAKLRKGNLFNINIDLLTCDVSYYKGKLEFENGVASLYNGTAQASSIINLPGPESFTLRINYKSIDSPAALRLIGWEPDIPAGKVEGDLFTTGKAFNPDGWFEYKATQQTNKNLIGRIDNIKGIYSLKNKIITFKSLKLNTPMSSLITSGTVDIKQKTLNLKAKMNSNDISDLTKPYYQGVNGSTVFSGEITGTFDNPKITGNAFMSRISIERYKIDKIKTSFSYEKNLLLIPKLILTANNEEHSLHGKISFPEAKGLFDIIRPKYDLKGSINNADLSSVIKMIHQDINTKGRINADFKIGGIDKDIKISGKASIENVEIYNIPFDSTSFIFSYIGKKLSIKNAKLHRGESVINAEAILFPENNFSFHASSKRILIKDFLLDHIPKDTTVKFQSEGTGTFDNPAITLNAQVTGGSIKGHTIGSGNIECSIKNKTVYLDGALFNEKMTFSGKGRLGENLHWTAKLIFHPGRYDFIVSSFLKEVPEDLQLHIEGNIDIEGDKENFRASAKINHLILTLYNQTFTNESDMLLLMENKKVSFKTFIIKSGSTSFRLKGGLEIGKEYNLFLDGSSSLTPLKGLSKKIGYLKGNADFVITISGKWDNPNIKGGMNLENASFGMRDYPTYISSINGYLTIEEDRIILKNLSGKIGGGDVNISGIVYLQGLHFKRFYVEAKLRNITTFLNRNFYINYNGDILYRGTLNKQNITGDIQIISAKYTKPIKWSNLILSSKTKEIPRAEVSAFENTDLNIKISGDKNISINNNLAHAPITVDMILKGTLTSPEIFGRLETKEGYAYFRNNEFRIISATADFADPHRLNPFINLSAETTIEGYKIRLNLEGQIDSFDLSLSSDPHLEEGDILALLTIGYVGEQIEGSQTNLGTGEATSIITGVAQEVLEERMRNIIGLDRFYIDTYVSKTTGTVVPRVTVAKRLVGDKLLITYAAPIGTAEEQIIKLEHFFDSNVSVIGIWDEIGGVGGDIKFRFEFK